MTVLAAGFPRASEADWRALAGELPSPIDSGIASIHPAADGAPIPGRRPGAPWAVVARVARGGNASATNARIMDELGGGADGIELVFTTSPSAFGGGLDVAAVNWAGILAGARPAGIALRIDAGEASATLASELIALAAAEGAALDLTVAFDPIATLAAEGRLGRPIEAIFETLAGMPDADGIRPVIADGAIWHNAGASEVEELAAALAGFACYLRMHDDRGVPPAHAARRIGVTLAADADQFATIAKMRAMRLLQARLLEAVGVPASRLTLHAATSWRMQSRLDPHTNILRTTSAVFAAGIGGADSVTALPFDAAAGGDDHFARRIARNSQTILLDESELARVSDPGAGSGAVEALTGHLAANAWDRFGAIERDGGLLAAVRSGAVQRMIGRTRDTRIDGVRRGRIEIVGSNAFPDGADRSLQATQVKAATSASNGAAAETVEGLRFMRLAEPFEMLRDRARAYPGSGPLVVLLPLGKGAAEATTRAASIFATAGIVAEVVEAAVSSPPTARLACICVDAKTPAPEIADAAARLRSFGAARVYLAGANRTAAAGVDAVLAEGIDLVDVLGDALDAAGEGSRP